MSTDNTEQHEIDAGLRVQNFLADEAVTEALNRLDAAYWQGFKNSATAEQRELFGAKARVVDDFRNALEAIVNNGRVATAKRERTNRR